MKKTLIIILCAISLGGGIAYFLFNKVVAKENPNTSIVSAFQIGVFTEINNAQRIATRNNGIVVNDNDVYRVYVAILKDQEAVNKLKTYYEQIGLNYYLKQMEVDKKFTDSISTNEELLKKSNSETYTTINTEILKEYQKITEKRLTNE